MEYVDRMCFICWTTIPWRSSFIYSSSSFSISGSSMDSPSKKERLIPSFASFGRQVLTSYIKYSNSMLQGKLSVLVRIATIIVNSTEEGGSLSEHEEVSLFHWHKLPPANCDGGTMHVLSEVYELHPLLEGYIMPRLHSFTIEGKIGTYQKG